jgi:hypothetical protein
VDLWFGRLRENGTYESVSRSVALPVLTPEIVVGWLRRGEELDDSQWFMQLLEWVRREVGPGADAP